MKNVAKIELTNEEGTTREVPVSLVLNPKKLMFIERDFPEAKHIIAMTISGEAINLDALRMYKVVYVSYRMANMNEYITFDEFQEQYEFDMEEASNIFYAMISKDFRSKYLEQLKKAIKSGDNPKA